MTREPDQAPRVLFLAGLGRSGTTLVERLLGQLPGVVPLGEVVHLWQRCLRDGERCGCGRPFPACPFWQQVGEAAFGGWHRVDVARIRDLRARVERTRHLPRLLLGDPRHRARVREYAHYYHRVYRAAATVAGARLVIDSSKHAALAWCLRRALPVPPVPPVCPGELRVAQVVRDPRAVAYSWTRRVARPESGYGDEMTRYHPGRSALLWTAQNSALALLAGTGAPVTRVGYERLLADPPGTLRALAAFAGLDLAESDLDFLGGGAVLDRVSHTCAGNPVRFRTGVVPLRPDHAWRERLAPRHRRLVTTLCAPLLPRYGYPLAPADRPAGAAPTRQPARGRVDPWPSVGVVIPTRDRPALLRQALAAVRAQDYPGTVRVVVVDDGSAAPDAGAAVTVPQDALPGAAAEVAILANAGPPGLAGARNTGIRALDTDLVAFCDDDDAWAPDKLRAQMAALLAAPGAELATCGIEVEYGGRRTPRLAGRNRVTLADLTRSRMAMLHSSTFVCQREALIDPDRIGPVAEDAPGSQNEDWDLLLRAARRAPIVHVDQPLVRIRWGRSSYYAHEYGTKISSLRWMLDRHPELRACRPGSARVYGQLACWSAATGQRRAAWRWAGRAFRHRWREPRAAIALAALTGAVKVETVLAALHRRGRGI